MGIKLWERLRIVIVFALLVTTLGSGSLFALAQGTDLTDIPSYVAPINFDVGQHAYVMTDSINLRSEPRLDSPILDTVEYEDELDVKDGPIINDEYRWWQVCFGGTCGWAADGNDRERWLLGLNVVLHGQYTPYYTAMSRAEGMGSLYFDDVPDLAYQGGPQRGGLVFAYFDLQLHTQSNATSNVSADVPLYNVMEVTDEQVGADGSTWWKLRTMTGREGWTTEFDSNNRLLAPIRTYDQWHRDYATSPSNNVFEYTVLGGQSRTMTGLQVSRGQTVIIEYLDGTWRAGPLPTWPFVGPEGSALVPEKSTFPVTNAWIMSLVGGIGRSTPFYVGYRYQFTSQTNGELWLGANDDNFTDNAGTVTVRVTIR